MTDNSITSFGPIFTLDSVCAGGDGVCADGGGDGAGADDDGDYSLSPPTRHIRWRSPSQQRRPRSSLDAPRGCRSRRCIRFHFTRRKQERRSVSGTPTPRMDQKE